MSHYVIKISTAQTSAKCKSLYRRIAVMEMEDGAQPPKMISDRASGCVRIVRTWEKLYVGTTDKCAFEVALVEAKALIEMLS